MYDDDVPSEWLADPRVRRFHFDPTLDFPIDITPQSYREDDGRNLEQVIETPGRLPNHETYDPTEEEIVVTGSRTRPRGSSRRARQRGHRPHTKPVEDARLDRSTSLLDRDTGRPTETRALSQDNFRTIKDPRLRGVNNAVR